MYNTFFLAGLTFEYMLGKRDVLALFSDVLITNRIDFKILLITYKALNGLAPQYLSELLSHYSPPRPLRSQTLAI